MRRSKKLNADMSLKPGTYSFTTLMDATKVVQQLMEGPMPAPMR